MELLYNVIFVTAVVLGYSWGGLLGAGVGLSLANFCDMLAINICYAYRYAYRMERSTLLHLLVQFLLLLSSILLCSAVEGVEKYAAGGILFCISLLFSYKMWRKKG
jgi:drug/metabolite transporter superfamily protein YnfA